MLYYIINNKDGGIRLKWKQSYSYLGVTLLSISH